MQNHKSFFLTMLGINLFFLQPGFAQTTQPADFKSPPQGRFFDQYYSLYLAQTKCGWVRMQFERRGQYIHSQNHMHMEVGRDNLGIVIILKSQNVETLDGKPVSFESKITMADSTTTYRGTVKNNFVTMEIIKPDASVKYKYEIPPDTVMDWGSHLQILKNIHKRGTKFTTQTLDPTLGQGNILETVTEIFGVEKTTIAHKEISGIKVISRAEKLGPLPIISYFDENGTMLSTEMQLGFAKVQIVADDEKHATTNIASKELFNETLVKLTAPMPKLSSKSMKFKIMYTGEGGMPKFPQTSIQHILSSDSKTQTLRISPFQPRLLSREADAPSAETLAGSSLINLDDSVLIEMAQTAAGGAKSSEAIARNLCRFVYLYIEEKNLATAFASAGEVARSKSGDCSEHAVLMTALARIHKIPSRTVMGLVYTPQVGEHGAFGYHMWTQVWLKDRWIDMDPTFDEVQVNPSHIAINFSDLSDGSMIQQVGKIIQLIGQLKITVEK